MRAKWVVLGMLSSIAAACGASDPTGVPSTVAVVEIDPPTASLSVGDTIRLTAVARDGDGRPVTGVTVSWATETSTLASVVGVGAQARVTLLAAGTAIITASTEGKTGRAEIDVEAPTPVGPVATVQIAVDSVQLAEGATAQLNATARDAEGRIVTGRFVAWTSSDPEVALVDALGAVTGIRAGTVAVTAKVDGVSASIPARVWADYPYELIFTGWDGVDGSTLRFYETDLGDPTRLAVRAGPDAESAAAVPSPDGTRIAYVLALPGGLRALMVADADGNDAVELHRSADVGCGSFTWSPDGERVAFACRIGDDDPDVWVVNADGTDLTNVTDAHHGRQESPSWSPVLGDGSSRIAYAQFLDGEPRIWTMEPDGSDATQITSGLDHQPAWSPDGASIAFQRTGAAIFGDIWLVDADGGNERGLVGVHLAGAQSSPAWSPDGRLLAFVSTHETYGSGGPLAHRIYTVWEDGSKLAARTRETVQATAPAWRVR